MGTTFFGVGASGSVGPTNGGKVWMYNNMSTIPETVISLNPARQTLTFHNPGTVTIWVAPLLQFNGTPLSPSTAALGGCFMLVSGGMLILTGECQGAWQAFSASGTGVPLTIMESNV